MSNNGTNDMIKNDETYALVGAICYIIYIAIILVAFILNTFKVYQDFFTTERKSVAHLKTKPKLTPVYTAIAAQTEAAILLFLVADIFEASTYRFAGEGNSCDAMQTAAGITYQVAQTFLYLLFLTRLYWIYSTSADPVSLQKIIVYSVILILFNVIIIVAMATIWTSAHHNYYQGQYEDVNYCDGTLEPITGTLMTIQEIVTTVAFLYAFYKQLQKTVADPHCKTVVVYAGRQLFIVSAVSMILTAVLIMVTAISDINFIIGADAVINVITLLMLEQYYSGHCYQKFCCCCRYVVEWFICCNALKTKDTPSQLATIIDGADNSRGAPLLAVKRATANNASSNGGNADQTTNVDENVETNDQIADENL
eukprot:156139_1